MDPSSFSDEPATESSAEQHFSSPIAFLIIKYLRYFGCELSSIFRVLQSFDLGGTPYDVARYIHEEQLPQYHEDEPRPDGSFTFIQRYYEYETRPYGSITSIQTPSDYIISVVSAQGRPVLLDVCHSHIMGLIPREMVCADTPDGRKIVTIVIEGLLRCAALGWAHFPVHRGGI